MPLDQEQIDTDVDFLTSQPGWKDAGNAEGRRGYIRDVAAKSLQADDMDPDHHAAVITKLWEGADERGMLRKAVEEPIKFVGRGLKEIALAIPTAGMASAMALSDAVGLSDTGSGTRLKRGVAGLGDAAVQRAKSLHPNDRQEQRDAALDALKKDLDARAHPDGLEAWVAGHFDGGKEPDAETKEWIEGLTWGLAKKAVAADHGVDKEGKVDKEKVRAWMESDRNPARLDSNTGPHGMRQLLGDYLVTRDPSSWEAFASRVKETDAQHTTRLRRYANEKELRMAQEMAGETGVSGAIGSLVQRGAEFQGSPIDMAMVAVPWLRGAKAYKAAKLGSTKEALAQAGKGVAIEAGSEGLTEALQDPNAPDAQIAEAAGLGAVGGAAVTGTSVVLGQVAKKLATPKVPPVVPADAPAGSLAGIAADAGRSAVNKPAAPNGPISKAGMISRARKHHDLLTSEIEAEESKRTAPSEIEVPDSQGGTRTVSNPAAAVAVDEAKLAELKAERDALGKMLEEDDAGGIAGAYGFEIGEQGSGAAVASTEQQSGGAAVPVVPAATVQPTGFEAQVALIASGKLKAPETEQPATETAPPETAGRGFKIVAKGSQTGQPGDLSTERPGEGGFIALPDLSGLTRLVKTGTPAKPGERTQVKYQGTGPFRVQRPNLRAILKGGLLPKQLADQLTQSQNDKAALNQTAATISNDLDKAINDYAERSGRPLQTVYDLVNGALEDPAMLALLMDPGLKAATWRARNFLDQLSDEVGNIVGGQTGATILQNLGSWMRRSYAAFDPASGWNLDAIEAAAKKGKEIAGKPAARILADAEAFLRGQYPNKSAGEIRALMKDLTDRDAWASTLTGEGAGVSKDVTSLMQRKDIPAELRALMGEETNPIKRVVKSASFQAQFIARHEMQKNMRRVGLALGLFSDTKTGEYNVQVGGDQGPLNRRWSGFGVLYTTPEMMAALQNARGIQTGTDIGSKFLEAVKFIGGEAKLNKVALNPDSWMPNLLGNLTGLVASGDVAMFKGWKNMWRAVTLMRANRVQKGEAMGTALGLLQDAQRQMLTRLRAAGVASGGLELQDVEANLDNRVLQFIQGSTAGNVASGAARGALLGRALGAPLGMGGKAAGAAVGGVAGAVAGGKNLVAVQKKIAEWVMSKPDNWGKIAVFLTNYEAHLEAGMVEEQAFKLAAEKALNTMPDYSKLWLPLKELSRLGAVGSFIAFQHEVYRNTYHNLKYGVQEVASGNAALMKRGAARLLGVGTMLSLGGWIGLSTLGMGRGAEKEKDEAYRRALARPWDRFSNLIYERLDRDGAVFTNTSYLIPQATIFELVRAFKEGKTWDQALGNVAVQLKDQFLNGSVHADPILEALTNTRKFGGKVTPETGVRGFYERLEHVLKSTATPGYADKAERIVRAVLGRSRGDRIYSIEEEAKRLLGIRQSSFTHEQRMVDRMYDFADRLKDAREIAKRAWNDNGRNKPDTIGRMEQENALARANAAIQKVMEDFKAWKKDLGELGISEFRVKKLESDRNVYVRPKLLKMTKDGPESVK